MLNRDKSASELLQEIQDDREKEERASAEKLEKEELENQKMTAAQEHKNTTHNPTTLVTEEYLVKTDFSDPSFEDKTFIASPTARNLYYATEKTQHLLHLKNPILGFEFMKKWLNESRSSTECIEYYHAILPIINESAWPEFANTIHKFVKNRILTIHLEAKEFSSSEAQQIAENFLNQRRPSKYQFFTKRCDTSSKKIFDKINQKKLAEAKTDLAIKLEKNEQHLEELLSKYVGL